MQSFKVVRGQGTGDASRAVVQIWDGQNCAWESDADSYIKLNGELKKLSDLTDIEILTAYMET